MYNIIVIGHNTFAQSIVEAVKGITGKQGENMFHCDFPLDECTEKYYGRLINLINNCSDKPILVLADIYGGTPCNMLEHRILKEKDNVHVITGINMPMLLEAYLYSEFLDIGSIVGKLKESPFKTILHL